MSASEKCFYTLDHVGLLSYDPQARTYSLGSQILSLGYGYLMSRDVVAVAMPHLDRLRDVTSWSAHLGERDGREVVYIARAATRRSTASSVQVGSRLPAHATSLGRVLLSALSDAEIETLYANTPLERFGMATVSSIGELCRQARSDADCGHVVQVSGFEPGIASVAAPVFDVGRRVVASVNVSVILGMTDEGGVDPVLRDHVLEVAGAISHDLGNRS